MCADQAAVFGVNTHYLVAVADRLSGIKDDKDGTRVGVFRITADEWEKLGKGPELTEPLPAAGLQRTRVQCIFAALQVQRAQKSFEKDNPNKSPSPADLYKIWPGNDRPGIKTLEAAIADTKALIDPADQVALEGELGGPIKLDFLTADQQSMAVKIIDAFEAAGCTVIAQAAALANAMAEFEPQPEQGQQHAAGAQRRSVSMQHQRRRRVGQDRGISQESGQQHQADHRRDGAASASVQDGNRFESCRDVVCGESRAAGRRGRRSHEADDVCGEVPAGLTARDRAGRLQLCLRQRA